MVEPSRSKQLKRGRQQGEGSSRVVEETNGGDETPSDEELCPKTRVKQGGGKRGRQQGQGSSRAVEETGGGDETPNDEEVRPKTREEDFKKIKVIKMGEEVGICIRGLVLILNCGLNFLYWANAASGIVVHDDCKQRFLELKEKRTFRFVVYKIKEKDKQKQIILEKLGESAESYENFQKRKVFFIYWSHDTTRVRTKMIYASSYERFKRELDGIQVELQATDPTEMDLDVIRSRAF
ncbi:uncharacterized protein LOC113339564 [Papaver somniferum]|uniref:uncharacterized protein LOC113339564 n=1 Tax=Papaver somniferum TaxID=3469 RepID=UPI000E6FD945|nr:uncharacterized protein LOC113339564 [Papaver somniferum]